MEEIEKAFEREFRENNPKLYILIIFMLLILLLYMSSTRTEDLKYAVDVGYANCMNSMRLMNNTQWVP